MAGLTPQEFFDRRPLNTLRAVDAAFLKEVSDELNMTCGLSLAIDQHKILSVMRDVLKFTYDWYFKAVSEKKVVVLNKDFCDGYQATGNSGVQTSVFLPNSVHSIYEIQPASFSYYSFQTRILDIPLLRAGAFTSVTDGFDINDSTYYDYSVADATIALYEQSQYRTHFSKGIPFDFVNGTGEFRILTRTNYDIVLGVFVKNDPSALYTDYYFKKHVVGECMKRAAMIYGTFDLKLAAGATINWSEIKSDGKEYIQECKDHYKATNATNMKWFK